MARCYFGTDGVRGVYGQDLTPELVEGLGRAFALWQGGGAVLIGRDTRPSGPMLEEVLAAGLASGGCDVEIGGVLPTPAVALLHEEAGAVISASHNPAEYNGVKFFARRAKLSDDDEAAVEALLGRPAGASGGVRSVSGLAERYTETVCDRFGSALHGLRIAVDCANGALYRIAPEAFARLGAEVIAVGVDPAGSINEGCGATDLTLLSHTVRTSPVDLGVAFDGDGDRMLAVDAAGNEIDGDQILAVLALHAGVDLVAVTSMTNLGFHELMASRGIRVVTTDVGDRYVLEALRREGGVLGGEQSGHVIWLDGHVSGDGLVAALLLCRALVERGQALSEAAAVMPQWAQAKANVRVRSKELTPSLRERIEAANSRLAGRGRVLVRPSGTEPLVRVLVEAKREQEANEVCASIAALVGRELGRPLDRCPE